MTKEEFLSKIAYGAVIYSVCGFNSYASIFGLKIESFNDSIKEDYVKVNGSIVTSRTNGYNVNTIGEQEFIKIKKDNPFVGFGDEHFFFDKKEAYNTYISLLEKRKKNIDDEILNAKKEIE